VALSDRLAIHILAFDVIPFTSVSGSFAQATEEPRPGAIHSTDRSDRI
jgi:hypothetical protein